MASLRDVDRVNGSERIDDGDDVSELSELDSSKFSEPASSELSDIDSSDLSELDSNAVSTPERFRSESPAFVAVSSSSSSSSSAEAAPVQRQGLRRSRRRSVNKSGATNQSSGPPLKRRRLSRNASVNEEDSDQVPTRFRLSKEPTELENTSPSQGMQPDDEAVHRDRLPGRSAPRATAPIRIPGKLAWPGFATTERVTFLSYPPADPAARRRIEKRLKEAMTEPKTDMPEEERSTVGYPVSDLRTRIDNAQPAPGRQPYSGTSDRERGWCAVAASLGQTVAETKAKVAEWERVNKAPRI